MAQSLIFFVEGIPSLVRLTKEGTFFWYTLYNVLNQILDFINSKSNHNFLGEWCFYKKKKT